MPRNPRDRVTKPVHRLDLDWLLRLQLLRVGRREVELAEDAVGGVRDEASTALREAEAFERACARYFVVMDELRGL